MAFMVLNTLGAFPKTKQEQVSHIVFSIYAVYSIIEKVMQVKKKLLQFI